MDSEEYTFNLNIDGQNRAVTVSISEIANLLESVDEYRKIQSAERTEKDMKLMLREAAAIAVEKDRISTSLLQRRLHIGYGRAAAIIEELADMGIVSDIADGNHGRDVLISSMDEYPEEEA